MDLISVVIPVYNAEEYVEQCIESVLNQTYENLEIIIINDGSKDNSYNVCSKYKNDQRVILINNPNNGLGYCRQMGFSMATGKYVCSFDSDDYLDRRMLEIMHSEIVLNEADICVCGRIDVFGGSKPVVNKGLTTEAYTLEITQNDISANFRRISSSVCASDTWNKLYKVDFIRNTGISFTVPAKYNGTDAQFNNELLLYCPKYRVLSDCLYYHRMYNQSMVRRKGKDLQGAFQFLVNSLEEQSKKNGFMNVDSFRDQISSYYYAHLYAAVVDKILESDSIADSIDRMNDILSSHATFCVAHKYLKDYKPRNIDNILFVKEIQNGKTLTTLSKLNIIRLKRKLMCLLLRC